MEAIIKDKVQKMNLDSISIILVRTKFPENIGSVARAMKNMGLKRLALVGGKSPFDLGAYKLASGAEDILERAEEFSSLKEAISEMNFVVGTTSRAGRDRSPLLSPKTLVRKLDPLSVKNSIAIVFGSEKEGLTNEELFLCNFYVRIPSSKDFPSLNLAHAVMVICYELFHSTGETPEHSLELAQADHLEKMFEHMERTLKDAGFLDSEHPTRMMKALRRLFGKSQLDEREVRILQGIWSSVDKSLRIQKEK